MDEKGLAFASLPTSATDGSLNKLIAILDSDASLLRAKDPLGNSLLHTAAGQSRNCALVSELIRRGLSPEERSSNGLTALHCAAKAGDVAMVRLLLDQHNAQLDARTQFTGDPFQLAEILKDEGLIGEIRSRGIDRRMDSLVDLLNLPPSAHGRLVGFLEPRLSELEVLIDCKDNALHLAAQFGKSPALITELINRGLSVEFKGQFGRTPLLKAARQGDLETAQHLLQQHRANLFAVDEQKHNALHLAAVFGKNPSLLTFLIEQGIPVDARGPLNRTAFLLAAKAGAIDAVRTLVDQHHADISAVDEDKNNALHLAARFAKNASLISFLVKKGLPVEPIAWVGRTPLLRAVCSGHLDTVRVFIEEHNANVHAVDSDGNNALHLAAGWARNPALVTYLIEKGLPVEAPGFQGRTPLLLAAVNGDLETLRVLVEQHNASITAVTVSQENALHLAAMFGRNPQLLSYLIDRGLCVTWRDNRGRTPLLNASIEGDVEAVKYLTDHHHADVHDQDADMNTAMHLSARFSKDPSLIRFLLSRGVSPARRNAAGRTPLIAAARVDSVEVVRLLLADSRTRINTAGEDKWTAVHVACEYASLPVVALLLSHGGDLSTRNQSNNTPVTVRSIATANANGFPLSQRSNWFNFLLDLTAKNRPIVALSASAPALATFQWSNCNHLIAICLPNCKLRTLPSQWQHLPNLLAIAVDNNELTELPDWLARCRSLATITAENNRICTVLSLPPRLHTLRLGSNALAMVPRAISFSLELRILHLNNNKLSSLPRSIAALPNLHTLFVYKNPLQAGYDPVTEESEDSSRLLTYIRDLAAELAATREIVEEFFIPDLAALIVAHLGPQGF